MLLLASCVFLCLSISKKREPFVQKHPFYIYKKLKIGHRAPKSVADFYINFGSKLQQKSVADFQSLKNFKFFSFCSL